MAHEGVVASFICIDCDLYESSIPVFSFIEAFLQEGTVIYIDDFTNANSGSPLQGLPKAFLQFKKSSRFCFEPFLPAGWWGRSFIAYRNVAR